MLSTCVRIAGSTARARTTCSIVRNGPVSPVPTATLPRIAASTTSHGDDDPSRSSAATADNPASAISGARGPKRSAGRRTAHVSSALPASVSVTVTPTPAALIPSALR